MQACRRSRCFPDTASPTELCPGSARERWEGARVPASLRICDVAGAALRSGRALLGRCACSWLDRRMAAREAKPRCVGFSSKLETLGAFPPQKREVSGTSHLFRHELQEFPKDGDLVGLVPGIFHQSFSGAFGGRSFVPAAQHHEHVPIPPRQWEPDSQTSSGVDAESRKRKHPPFLPCLCSTWGGPSCVMPETLSLLKLPKRSLERREAASGDVLRHCLRRATWDVRGNPKHAVLPKTGAASPAHVEQIPTNGRAPCSPPTSPCPKSGTTEVPAAHSHPWPRGPCPLVGGERVWQSNSKHSNVAPRLQSVQSLSCCSCY